MNADPTPDEDQIPDEDLSLVPTQGLIDELHRRSDSMLCALYRNGPGEDGPNGVRLVLSSRHDNPRVMLVQTLALCNEAIDTITKRLASELFELP